MVLARSQPKPVLKLLGERYVQPTALVPLDGSRLLLSDQIGRLFLVDKSGATTNKLLFDFGERVKFKSGGFDERGLVGLAVHPKFSENHKFYAYYSAPLRDGGPAEFDHTVHLSEFILNNEEVGNERLLLQIDMPYLNHHSGRLAFGPDRFLYVGVGDGGNANDVGRGHSPQGNGQDTQKLHGKILRIDVDRKGGDTPYAIPSDNPFATNGKGRPEIFAWGFRNPWGIAFDRGGKHELFVADVGQDSWEEIDIVTKGGNYGWNIREAFVCFDPQHNRQPPADCPKTGAMGEPLLDPIVAYKNFGKYSADPEARGCSITGGYVYRGKRFPHLVGKYIFADWSRSWAKADGVLYMSSQEGEGKWTISPLAVSGHDDGRIGQYVTAMGEDADGELYVMTNGSNMLKGNNGKLWQLAE